MTVQQLDVLRDQLKQELSSSSSNLQKVGQLLTQAKVISCGNDHHACS